MMKNNDNTDKQDERLSGALRIFEALSSVDEELLERCDTKEKVIPFWRYAKVMAACVCFVVVGVAAWTGSKLMVQEENTSADCAMPQMHEQAAAAVEDTIGGTVIGDENAGVEEDRDGAVAEPDSEEQEATSRETMEITQEEGLEDESVEMEKLETDNNESQSETANMEGDQSAYESADTYDYADAKQEEAAKEVMDEPGIGSVPIQNTIKYLDLAKLRAIEGIGEYIPTVLPAGYIFESGYSNAEDDASENVSLLWTKGMDTIHITIRKYEVDDETAKQLVDVSNPETYDVHLYEIPYGETVPEEFREMFSHPVFAEDDFTLKIVKARMKTVADEGDTDTPRGNFSVLYDSGVIVEFSGRGDAESIWKMFESIRN